MNRHPKFPYSEPCRKPKMSSNAGAIWDRCDVVAADGSEMNGYFETTRGGYFYFEHEGKWRRASMARFFTHRGEWPTADFRNPIQP